MDPDVIAGLLTRHAADVPLQTLTPRTRSPRPDGRRQIQRRHHQPHVHTKKAVSKHSNNIFTKLGLEQSSEDNRRVLAVLTYLKS